MADERQAGRGRSKGPSLSAQVILGLVFGIAAGIFFGELAAPIGIVGDAFIRLLQMTVLPYLVFSLIAGLGNLEPREARVIALRAGTVLLLLWALTLLLVVLIPLAYPDFTSAAFFSARLTEEREPFDFLALYIPANPIFSMGHNVIPAVVLFSVVLGVGLMGVAEKRRLIEPLEVLVDVIMRVTSFVARLAPYGVFALAARAAGTLGGEELERLQVYLVTFAAAALLLTFWLLPGLVTSLTPLTYRDVLGRTRDALVTAFATGNLLIVLPILARESKAILQDCDLDQEDLESAVDVVVPASFNFPSAGKLLGLSFLPFGAWFVDAPVRLGQALQLLSTGPLSFFGQTSTAIPMLLDLLELPADLFDLFLAVDVVTGRFGVLLAAMHILVLALVCPWAMQRGFALRWRALLRFAVVSVALVLATLLGTRLLLSHTLKLETSTYRTFIEMNLRFPPVQATRVEEPPPPEPGAGARPRLEAIGERGVLRVGYFRDALPYAFVNAAAVLVGHDVDMAHQLARDLGVSIRFIRIERPEMAQRLADGTCDIVMSGVAVTPGRSREMILSVPYMDNALSFLVRDHRRHEFARWEQVRKLADLRIGVPGVPYYVGLVRERLPNATVVSVESFRPFLRGGEGDLDAMIFGAEAGAAWTMVYPAYSVVVPKPDPVKVPLAYLMPRYDGEWADYVNTWLELKKSDNTLHALYEHWILGKAAEAVQPRWSVIRDVFGWVE